MKIGLKSRMTIITLFIIVLSVLAIESYLKAPEYKGPLSEHYNGDVFINEIEDHTTFYDLGIMWFGNFTKGAVWPNWIEQNERILPIIDDGLAVTYINHATVLIQVNGINIITDPVYSERVSPFDNIGPKRVRAPGIKLENLPPIDIVLISHNHYDHLDLATLKALKNRNPPNRKMVILSGLGNSALLEKNGLLTGVDLDWEQSKKIDNIEYIFTQSQHRSGRAINDQMKNLWGSFVIKTTYGNVYFSGDTGYGSHFKNTGGKHGPFKVALLPIGAYEPRWFMKTFHTNPSEAVQAHKDLNSELSIGIHFGTFKLTYEAIDQPLIDLEQAKKNGNIAKEEFIALNFGETLKVTP